MVCSINVPVENRAGLSCEAFAVLAENLRAQHSIRLALAWLLAHQPACAPEVAIAQDEFSHDLIVPFRQGLYLVYDST